MAAATLRVEALAPASALLWGVSSHIVGSRRQEVSSRRLRARGETVPLVVVAGAATVPPCCCWRVLGHRYLILRPPRNTLTAARLYSSTHGNWWGIDLENAHGTRIFQPFLPHQTYGCKRKAARTYPWPNSLSPGARAGVCEQIRSLLARWPMPGRSLQVRSQGPVSHPAANRSDADRTPLGTRPSVKSPSATTTAGSPGSWAQSHDHFGGHRRSSSGGRGGGSPTGLAAAGNRSARLPQSGQLSPPRKRPLHWANTRAVDTVAAVRIRAGNPVFERAGGTRSHRPSDWVSGYRGRRVLVDGFAPAARVTPEFDRAFIRPARTRTRSNTSCSEPEMSNAATTSLLPEWRIR